MYSAHSQCKTSSYGVSKFVTKRDGSNLKNKNKRIMGIMLTTNHVKHFQVITVVGVTCILSRRIEHKWSALKMNIQRILNISYSLIHYNWLCEHCITPVCFSLQSSYLCTNMYGAMQVANSSGKYKYKCVHVYYIQTVLVPLSISVSLVYTKFHKE